MTEFEKYRDTGILGDYDPKLAVLRKSEDGGVNTIFRDSRYTNTGKEYTRERQMLIKGKRFIVSSVFLTEPIATATDKMLSLIDEDLEKESKVI